MDKKKKVEIEFLKNGIVKIDGEEFLTIKETTKKDDQKFELQKGDEKDIERLTEEISKKLVKKIECTPLEFMRSVIKEALKTYEFGKLLDIEERLKGPKTKVKKAPGCVSLKITGKPGKPFELYITGP